MSTNRLSADSPELAPFVSQAEANVAKIFGLASLDDTQKKALGINIYREALKLHGIANPKEKVNAAVDRPAAFFKMLQRAFGYAIKFSVSRDSWVDNVQKAINDPIAPTERKPRGSSDAAGDAGEESGEA
jgi:hypothetical protein